MGVSASVLSVPAEVICHVSRYLSSTQIREGLCAVHVDSSHSDAVYDYLAKEVCNNARKPGQGRSSASDSHSNSRDIHQRVQVAYNKAVAKGYSSRRRFWAVQRKLCEACFQRQSCSRAMCRHCSDPLPLRGMDMCCACFPDFLLRGEVEEERSKAELSIQIWNSRIGNSVGHPLVRIPEDWGEEFGGLVVRRSLWDKVAEASQLSLQKARRDRGKNPLFAWVSTGLLDQSTAADIEFFGLLWEKWPWQHEFCNDRFSPLAWQIVQEYAQKWRCEPADGDCATFFELEDKLVHCLCRCVVVMSKLYRLGQKQVEKAVFAGVSKGRRKLKRPTLRLDALGIVLCGFQISEAKVPTAIVREVRRAVFDCKGAAAMHICERVATALSTHLESSNLTSALARHTDIRVSCGLKRGLTMAEIWCGEAKFRLRTQTKFPNVADALLVNRQDIDPWCENRVEKLINRVVGQSASQIGDSEASEVEPPVKERKNKCKEPVVKLRKKQQSGVFSSKTAKLGRGGATASGFFNVLSGRDLLC